MSAALTSKVTRIDARANETRVASFVRELAGRGATSFELRQMGATGEQCVRPFEGGPEMSTDGIATRILECAREESEVLGPVTFSVVGFVGAEAVRARCLFRVMLPAPHELVPESPEDAATVRGIVQHLIQSNLAILRVALSHSEAQMKSYERDRELFVNAHTELITQKLDLLHVAEKLYTQQSERDALATREQSDANLKERAFGLLQQMVPELIKQSRSNAPTAKTATPAPPATPSGKNSRSDGPAPAPPATPPSENDEAGLVTLKLIARLTDQHLEQLEAVGLVTPEEKGALERYRAELRAGFEAEAAPPAAEPKP